MVLVVNMFSDLYYYNNNNNSLLVGMVMCYGETNSGLNHCNAFGALKPNII